MKRIISVILTIAMVLGISIETFAAYGGEKSRAYQSENCTITYSIANEWSGNQQISVSITNDGEETLRNWAVMFDNAGKITNIWNAEVCRNDGELCVIRNNGYNYEIIPNGTVEFGFMLQGEDLSLPEDISLCSRTADSTESAEISYEIQNNWGDGFIAAVTVKNTSEKPLEAWKLSFNGNFDISTIWNANLLYTDDGSFKVENDITTTPIPVGGEKVFSFQGVIASGETPVLSDFKLTSIVIDTERIQPVPPVETEEAPSHETTEPSTGDEPEPTTEETNETEEPVDPDPAERDENTILCFGEYLSEENSIKVYWYSTAEGAVSIHENTDGNGWKKLAEVTDGDFYEFTITEDFVIKYIKVSQQTADGMIESEPFIVAASEDGYACTWLDSDNDGLPDYAEKIYGTDPENADTDGDGLSDYDEIYKTGTNPLKYDTDDDGVNDADSDNDKDGLTNSEELALGTDPNSADTDGDGLSDYDEINKHNTDPLKADSDGDTLNDGDEIILGLDPNDPETFGVPDAEYKVKQTISADSEVMERVNTEDSPYELSLEITASGNAQNLIAGSSAYSAITESDARLGGAVSLDYYGGDVEKVKLSYEIGENYVSNEGSEYAKNCVDLQGIKRYNIFRYFEELNMLLPVATEFDEENNTLSAETDELGTYCVLDMEVLLQTFGVNPDGSQTEQVEKQMYAGVNDGYNICFIIDTRKDVITEDQLENIKNEIIAFMSNAVTNGKLIGVTICVQNYTDFSNNKLSAELLGHYSTVEELTAALKEVKLDNKYDDNDFVRCCITDGIGLLSYQSRGTNNYVFDIFSQTDCIFNRTKFDEIERNAISTGVNISFITDNRKIDSYQTEIPEETNGIVLNSFSNFAKKAYNHVFEEPLVEFDGFSAILATGYQTVELKEELNSFNGCHSDDDNITDWDEVDVDYWASCGLITFDDNNNVVLPTLKQCMDYTDKSYVEEGLGRFISQPTISLMLDDIRIMPISSDPTREDSDGDGIADKYDPHKLLAIDVDTPCLYDNSINGSNNHRLMVIPFSGEVYHCTNCDYEVVAPELEDRVNLDDDDYVLVKSLLSLIYNLCQNNQIYSAEMLYAVVDKIRYYNSKSSYSMSDEEGRYCSPMLYSSMDNDNNFWISVDLYNSTNLYRLEQLLNDLVFYSGKTAVDIAMLSPEVSLPIGIAWVILSEFMVCVHETGSWNDSNELSVKLGTFYACYDNKFTSSTNILSSANTFLTAWNLIGVFGQKINTYWSSPELYYGISIAIVQPEFEHCFSFNLDGIIANDSLLINYKSFTEHLFKRGGEMKYRNTITLSESSAFGENYNYCWGIIGDTYFYRKMNDILNGDLSWIEGKEIKRGKYK